MHFANVRELKLETNKVLSLSKTHGPIIITRKGKPVAFLKTINEDDLSVNVGSLWDCVKKSAERSGYGPKDVEKLITTARTSKKCSHGK
jgi:antitoxin (DNA-binding transcriptional repressor) of toxin-antitoxin stability system